VFLSGRVPQGLGRVSPSGRTQPKARPSMGCRWPSS